MVGWGARLCTSGLDEATQAPSQGSLLSGPPVGGAGSVCKWEGRWCWPLAQGRVSREAAGAIVITECRAPDVGVSHWFRLGCSVGSI